MYAKASRCLSIGIAIMIGALFNQAALAQGVMNFNNSPNNWVNSPNNFDNSSNNWVNSPNNFNNSPNNFSATNGVYDNRGNRIGYEVTAPSGSLITLITAAIAQDINQVVVNVRVINA